MSPGSFTLETKHGLISVIDTALKNSAPALLLIHGNSSSSRIWRHILESPTITQRYRVLAFDLPGHGASSNALKPEQTYNMRGYADVAKEIIEHLCITKLVVLGWSLGGHIGIELLPLLEQSEVSMKGLMLVGSPPALGLEQTNRGFRFKDGHMSFAGRIDWSEDEAREFARTSAPAGKEELFEEWMESTAKRTDGRARQLMWKKFADGVGVDQRGVVEGNKNVLIAVVNGGDEPYVDLDYLDELKWGRLWKDKCLRLEGLKHAPFWEEPDLFESVLAEFMSDCEGV